MMTPITIVLSGLGLVPFIVFGLGALGTDPLAAVRMVEALIDYGALVLAFAGGVHWGLALAPREDTIRPAWQRMAFGAAGLVVGWVALLLARMLVPWMSLLVLIAGYIAAIVIEHGRRAWLPPRWLWVRWGFTVVAVAMMTTVLTLRLLGQTVVF